MGKNFHVPKLTFSITPNTQGYLISCNEIPYLFTDSQKFEDIDNEITNLVEEYIEYFPFDAKRRGIDSTIPTEATWKGSPNSVALE